MNFIGENQLETMFQGLKSQKLFFLSRINRIMRSHVSLGMYKIQFHRIQLNNHRGQIHLQSSGDISIEMEPRKLATKKINFNQEFI